jgi:asparagine synthase (glutamine-hydrolysing)
MCGICGVAFAERDRPADQDLLARMTASLHHRGPDGRGFFFAPGVGLGMTRLSIVDLATGDQPISSEDGMVTLICNGEIYNSADLREKLISRGHRFRTHSDVEVIIHLYEDHGTDCVHHLRGMFAFALWDDGRKRLMLARDRLGIKPLHYSLTNDACWFGSEQKAILASDAVERALDVNALADLGTLGVTRTPRTFFTSILRLPPAHFLLYERGNASVHEYWDVDFTPNNPGWSPRDWADALRDKLAESVRSHLMSDVPVGAWLSAGIDSSSIVALMNRLGQRNIPTFTLAFDQPDFDEVRTQQLLYDFPGYSVDPHTVTCGDDDISLLPKVVWHAEDPVVGGVEIPRLLLATAAAEYVKVVLTGEGSDELLGGYELFRLDKFLRPFALVPESLRQRVSAAGASRFPRGSRVNAAPREMRMARYLSHVGPIDVTFSTIFSRDVQDRLAREGRGASVDELPLPDAFDMWDPLSQLQYYEMKTRLPDRIESILDRLSMAQSLEARVPFLDHELVEFCAGIPAPVKLRWFTEKQVLREAMREVLPPELARRKKRGLAAPLRYWLRDPLPDFAQELLSESALRRTGYFDPAAVAATRDRPARSRQLHPSARLMKVLMLQLWHELFIERRTYPAAFRAKNSF